MPSIGVQPKTVGEDRGRVVVRVIAFVKLVMVLVKADVVVRVIRRAERRMVACMLVEGIRVLCFINASQR